MNLILTTDCDKGCNYCFGRNWKPGQDMSLEQVEWCINQEGPRLNLLGGEPTMHPEIVTIIRMSKATGKWVRLFSNLLFPEHVLKAILPAVTPVMPLTSPPIEIIANSTDLEIGDRKEVWLKNYRALQSAGVPVQLSITVVPGQDYSWVGPFIDETQAPSVRISTAIPVTRGPNPYIGNTEYGKILSDIAAECNRRYIRCDMDCAMLPCMFDGPVPNGVKPSCCGPPGDFFPDWTVRHCTANGVITYVTKNSNYAAAISEIQAVHNKRILEFPKDIRCEGCELYGTSCTGPCPAYDRVTS